MSRILETVDDMITELREEAERENVFLGRATYTIDKLTELRFRLAYVIEFQDTYDGH